MLTTASEAGSKHMLQSKLPLFPALKFGFEFEDPGEEADVLFSLSSSGFWELDSS